MERIQSPSSVLRVNLEGLRERIIANMDAAGQRASGRTAESLRVEVTQMGTQLTGTLYGRAFFGALETGSRPWRNQYKRPPRWFVEILGEWIRAKGLTLSEWAVAYKLMREGSKLYRDGGRADIYSGEIPSAIDTIGKQLIALYDYQITETIKLNSNEN